MKKSIHNPLNQFVFDIVRIENLNYSLAKALQNVLLNKNIECVIDVDAMGRTLTYDY